MRNKVNKNKKIRHILYKTLVQPKVKNNVAAKNKVCGNIAQGLEE